MNEFKIIRFSENPDLKEAVAHKINDGWYEFMRHDRIASKYREYRNKEFGDYQFYVVDNKENVLAVCKSVPTYWDGSQSSVPESYDSALEFAIDNYKIHGKSNWNTLLGTSVHVFKNYRNLGLSAFCLEVMKGICRRHSFLHLLIPIRPVLKHKYPLTTMEEYLSWKNSDGQVFDPWLRTHLRIGGRVLQVSNCSMLIEGSIAEWSKWTNMEFPSTGKYIVDGALSPVNINCETNIGTYCDSNIWVVHTI